MNITGLTITDPRKAGRYVDPIIIIEVDEPVDEIAAPLYPGKGHVDYKWKVTPCGPFVAVEQDVRDEILTDHPDWINTKSIGIFNTLKVRDDDTWELKPYWHEPLYPVGVIDPEQEHDLFIGISRMRRLLRKHRGAGPSGWSLILDDQAGLNAELKWWAELNDPICFMNRCQRDVRGHVWYGGAHLPTCHLHRTDIERKIRSSRVQSAHNPDREKK